MLLLLDSNRGGGGDDDYDGGKRSYKNPDTTYLLNDPINLTLNVLFAVQCRYLGYVSLSRMFERVVPFGKDDSVANRTTDRFEYRT